MNPRHLILTYNDYAPQDAVTKLRFRQARLTWNFQFWRGNLIKNRVETFDLARNSSDIGDDRPVPYVKDLIEAGMNVAREQDAVLISNRDVCLTATAPHRIWDGLGAGIAACPRRDMGKITTGRLYGSVLNCRADGGYDLFAITPKWWRNNHHKMPDMLLGREMWDTCLRVLAIESGAICVDDTSYHSAHVSYWEQNRYRNAGQRHNVRLGLRFLSKRHGWFWWARRNIQDVAHLTWENSNRKLIEVLREVGAL